MIALLFKKICFQLQDISMKFSKFLFSFQSRKPEVSPSVSPKSFAPAVILTNDFNPDLMVRNEKFSYRGGISRDALFSACSLEPLFFYIPRVYSSNGAAPRFVVFSSCCRNGCGYNNDRSQLRAVCFFF